MTRGIRKKYKASLATWDLVSKKIKSEIRWWIRKCGPPNKMNELRLNNQTKFSILHSIKCSRKNTFWYSFFKKDNLFQGCSLAWISLGSSHIHSHLILTQPRGKKILLYTKLYFFLKQTKITAENHDQSIKTAELWSPIPMTTSPHLHNLPAATVWETLQKAGKKDCKSQRKQGFCYEVVSPGNIRSYTHKTSSSWLSIHELNK